MPSESSVYFQKITELGGEGGCCLEDPDTFNTTKVKK